MGRARWMWSPATDAGSRSPDGSRRQASRTGGIPWGRWTVQADGDAAFFERLAVRAGGANPFLDPLQRFVSVVLLFAKVEKHDFVHWRFLYQLNQLFRNLIGILVWAELHTQGEMAWH